MNQLPGFREDDENNTLTFERWEAYVVEHYPNPERLGCPGDDVLKRFVDTPAAVGLDQLNDTHITRCRECTLELRRLRESREQLIATARAQSMSTRSKALGFLIAACLVIAVGIGFRKIESARQATSNASIAKVDVDLSGDGVVRGSGSSVSEVQVSLRRTIVELHVKLPYYSPAGTYRVTVQSNRNAPALRDVNANAEVNGPHADLHVTLDLRDLRAGKYLLGTRHDGEMTYYYPLSLN
ncbi:hypothetical protein [Acidicapsa ligni]|uniref:hypothetical protein n=1 Tax=Acidicapsa ligni TaxID=542300 RepID=UPI0021E09810|nr:hypothetical protein [Acidicapsa ligni]